MNLLDGRFDAFKALYPSASQATFPEDYKNFAIEEFRRFHSIGGTILESILPLEQKVGERLYSHILLRSIFENYFWLIYIFDGQNEIVCRDRFNEYMNGFKNEYYKLHNEAALPHKDQLVLPDAAWRTLRAPDVRSLLTRLTTIRGEKLDYLYFVYRITSFDTHGKTMKVLFNNAFKQDCNFPVMKVKEAINLIADSYVALWGSLGG